MSTSHLSTQKRIEHVAVGTGVVLASFAALSWALSTDAQAATVDQEAAVPAGSLGPQPLPEPTLAAIGVSEVPAPFDAALVTPATPEPVVTTAAPVAVEPGPEPKKKDPALLESGWYIPVAKYSMTARFGVPGSWSSGYHTGLDLATNEGRLIRALTDGKVVSANYEGAYGNLVRIKIGPKTEIWMAHLDNVKVSKGDRVKAGEAIGTVGMTGRTSGPHLHLEVRVNDKPKNPEEYLWPSGKISKKMK